MKLILLSTLLYGCQTFQTRATGKDFMMHNLDKIKYRECVFQFSHAKINLFLNKDSALTSEKIINSVNKVWPLYEKQFSTLPSEITIVDSEGPIGGGPTKPFTVAVYSTKQFGPLYKTLVLRATGWQSEENTRAYIIKYYSDFADPEQAYIDDIVIHEMAHTIFGFGLTKASVGQEDWWFTFGLGLLYDRMIWQKLYTIESPLFSSAVRLWKNHYSQIYKLDQRLIRPDLSLDEKYKLSRLQVYGHGKALVYLSELRQLIGSEYFDRAVAETIVEQKVLDYDEFIIRHFSNKKREITALENEYQVR